MRIFIIMIIIGFLGILTGFLPAGFSIISFFVMIGIGFILALVSFIQLLIKIKEKSLLLLIFYLLYFLFFIFFS